MKTVLTEKYNYYEGIVIKIKENLLVTPNYLCNIIIEHKIKRVNSLDLRKILIKNGYKAYYDFKRGYILLKSKIGKIYEIKPYNIYTYKLFEDSDYYEKIEYYIDKI